MAEAELAKGTKIGQAAGGALLSLLLAGYLIFNKPFALLGCPSLNIYLGEVVLFCLVLVCAADYKSVFIEPLRRSWIFRLIAVFFLYGVLRAAVDIFDSGVLALRDGVIASYALAAFLAPAVWNARLEGLKPLVRLLLPASLCGAVWAAAVAYGYIDLRRAWGGFLDSTKPDFLALAAAVAFWVYGTVALRWTRRTFAALAVSWESRDRLAPRWAIKTLAVFFAAAAISWMSYNLMVNLPTRGVKVAGYPLLGLGLAAWLSVQTRRSTAVLALAGLLLLAVPLNLFYGVAQALDAVFSFPSQASKAASVIYEKYAPDKDLDFSLRQVEADLRKSPAPAAPKNPETAPANYADINLMNLNPQARHERELAMVSINQNDFKTTAGELARDATEWRLLFWLRTLHYTFHHAPCFGLGFGVSLTNVNRRSPQPLSDEAPGWRKFLPSFDMQNRSPHCAHLTVLARMGVAGLGVWLALLAAVLAGALCQCWRQRREMFRCVKARDESGASEHSRSFWYGLAILGVWLLYLSAMSFGVVLENPFGGIWFWTLTGMLGYYGSKV